MQDYLSQSDFSFSESIQVQETFSPQSETIHDAYLTLVQDFLALCIKDYVDFAYPNNRNTTDDWIAYETAAAFLFDDAECMLVHPVTLKRMILSEMLPLVTEHKQPVKQIRRTVQNMAKQKVSKTKPAFSPPSRFTDEHGVAWGIVEDPLEPVAYVNMPDNKIIMNDAADPMLFLIGLMHMANQELELNIDEDALDKLGKKFHTVLAQNKFFRVRVVANVEVSDDD